MVNVTALTKMVIMVEILGYMRVRLRSGYSLLSNFIVNRYWLSRRMALTVRCATALNPMMIKILIIGLSVDKIVVSFIFYCQCD